MAKIEVSGYEFDYTDDGAGQPVVLVHGSVSDRRMWEAQLDSMRETYRVIAYSRRYHWPNAPMADGADY